MESPGADPWGDDEPTAEARRLRVLLDRLPALISYWDRDLRNVVANHAYVEWFGLTPEQVRGRHVREVLGEDLFAVNEPRIKRALSGEEVVFQTTFPDASGAHRSTEASYVPDIVDGEVPGFFVHVVDVTRRVEAQRLMDEAQELAELGSWTMEHETQRVYWSRQMFRITGRDAETFVPTTEALAAQVHPDDRERVVAAGTAAARSGERYELGYRLVRPDGEVREVHSRVHAELDPDGVVTRLNGTMQDVTHSNQIARQMSRANEKLRQVNQLNADVLGIVGHDVQTPIALVQGHLEELLDTWSEKTDEVRRDRVERAYAASQRLSALMQDILAMTSADSGDVATRQQHVAVREVVELAVADVRSGATIDVRGPEDVRASVDPFHLRQIVTNLVSNARRYGAEPISVDIAPAADAGVSLVVTDHGQGVPADFVPQLFERFTRAATGVAAQQSGSGFGLYVVRRLAEANGARVDYEPHVPTGSRFTVRLRPADH